MGQLWYELVLHYGDRSLVDDYQLFKGDVDFHDDAFTQATNKLDEWIKAGYIASDSAALTAEDMGVSFINGTYPIMVSGSWWFGRLNEEIPFQWSQGLFPGNDLHPGSSGNLWVVPENAANKDLAYDFIDITLSDEVQEILGQAGGLPVASTDASGITDEKTREMTENFNTVLDEDGLAFYPDWPVAGFYDVIVSEMQSLINQSKTPDEVLDSLSSAYEDGKTDLLEADPPRRSRRHGDGRRASHPPNPAETCEENGPLMSTTTTATTPSRRRKNRGKWGYVPYLLPGLIGFTVIILIPFGMNIYYSLHKWKGGNAPMRWYGLGNYADLMQDEQFWTSFKNSIAMIGAMVIIPTVIGLLLATVLFDVLGKRFGPRVAPPARAVLPAADPAGRRGRCAVELDPELPDRRGERDPARDRDRQPAELAGLHRHRPAQRDAGADLDPDRLPGGHLHVRAAAGRPRAVRGGRAGRRGLVAPVQGDHAAADQAGDVRHHADLHGRRAEGLRTDLRADPRWPGEFDAGAELLLVPELLRQVEGRLRRRDRQRPDAADHRGRGRHHGAAGPQCPS